MPVSFHAMASLFAVVFAINVCESDLSEIVFMSKLFVECLERGERRVNIRKRR